MKSAALGSVGSVFGKVEMGAHDAVYIPYILYI